MNATIHIDPEFRNLIPPLAPDELAQLEASLLAEGCRDALVVWKGRDILVDGHNRHELSQKHNIEYRTVEREFNSRADVVIWMIQNQLARRNVQPFVRGELALRMKEAIAEKAKTQQGQRTDMLLNSSKSASIHTRKELAKAAETSEDTIRKVEHITKTAPEPIKQAARSGDISTHRAFQITQQLEKLPAEHRERVASLSGDVLEKYAIMVRLHKSMGSPDTNGTYEEILRTGGFHHGREMKTWCDFWKAAIEEITKALQSVSDHHRHNAVQAKREAAAATPAPQGKYKTIVIDPPWSVDEREARPNQQRRLDDTMVEEIQALDIRSLAFDDGCHLYIWATHKYLPAAIALVGQWGFEYQCVMTWVKPTGMTSYSWMHNTEFVVFARLGSLDLQRQGLKLSFEEPDTGHSVKPDVFYEHVMLASPEPRLEMFAKHEREGFEVWESEVRGE